MAAASPLAFWRKKRGFSQTSLAAELGIAQNYVSDIENGKRSGPVELWLKLSRTLQVPLGGAGRRGLNSPHNPSTALAMMFFWISFEPP